MSELRPLTPDILGALLSGLEHQDVETRRQTVSDLRYYAEEGFDIAGAFAVLRHRFGLNFTAVSEGYNTDNIIDWLLEAVPLE